MRPTDVSRALAALLPTKQPIYLWGQPGIGKSALVRQATREREQTMLDLRAVLLDPVDLRGLPVPNGDCVHWKPPAFLPRSGEGVLFLDELAQAPPLVQAACLQLCLDRRVGEYELPDGWAIVAASNRQEDRAGAHRLITPLLNRFIHLDLEVSNDDWHEWAVNGGIRPEVIAFERFRPALLNTFDPTKSSRAFATPRSWEFVSNMLPVTPEDLLHPVVAGAIGDGPAAEFTAFCRLYRELPDVDELIKDPKKGKMPSMPDILFALSGAIVERCRNLDEKLLDNVLKYALRMPSEFAVLTIRDAAIVRKAILAQPSAKEVLTKYRDILLPQAMAS